MWRQWPFSSHLTLQDYGCKVRLATSISLCLCAKLNRGLKISLQVSCLFFSLFLLFYSGWEEESQVHSCHSVRDCQGRRVVSKQELCLSLALLSLSALVAFFLFEQNHPRLSVPLPVLCRLAPYRGWLPVICSLCCSNFVYFYCFHSLRASWLRGHKSTPSRDLLMGIAAGRPT